MRQHPTEPGVYFEAARPRPQPSPVRSDVAGLMVRTQRGPVGRLVRVEGWRQCRRVFGTLISGVTGPYAMRGYFENGGEVAHVWRAAGPGTSPAYVLWDIDPVVAARGGFASTRYRFVASSPGAWGNEVSLQVRYRLRGRLGTPEVDVVVRAPGEPSETFRGVPPLRLLQTINPSEETPDAGSVLVRLISDEQPVPAPAGDGPAELTWRPGDLRFTQGTDFPPGIADYDAGVQALIAEPEVAILATPDLLADLPQADVDELVTRTVAAIDPLHDRLLLLDVPPAASGTVADPGQTTIWLASLRARHADGVLRNVAVWHPPLGVPDPLGAPASPLKMVPASGHVAGVVSRLDRERGPHWTPANAECSDAVAVAETWALDEREAFYRDGVNLVRCMPGRGLQLWGAWTAVDPARTEHTSYLYLAHRRLIHRIVRAVRTLAEPLVFEGNTSELRFSVYRAVYGLLLRFWRAGAFKGARPEEAFRVVCDDSNNPPAEQDNGRLWCEIQIAPAVPMEFITLRVALGETGRLEVFA
jgi:uncharacterized protein